MNNAMLPYDYYPNDAQGRPLFNAYIYIGVPNLDPQTPANQYTIYGQQENGTEVVIAQPVRTGAGGVPMYNGSPVVIKLPQEFYAIKVLDRNLQQVYYNANVAAVLTASILSSLVATVKTIQELRDFAFPKVDQQIMVLGHTTYGVGGGVFRTVAGASTDDNGCTVNSSVGSFHYRRINFVDVQPEFYGAVGNLVADDTVPFQDATDYAITNKVRVDLTQGSYLLTDTITVADSNSIKFFGSGERLTEIRFQNVTADKVMFDLLRTTSNNIFEDVFITDNPAAYGTSTFMRATDSLTNPDPYSHYKDGTRNVRVFGFKTGVILTSDQPTVGATHAYLSECLFFNTRFRNCRTTFLIQNIQAVDLTLVSSDIENDDPGENYTFFRDEAGITIQTYGGSFVGKGVLYECIQAVGSTDLWQAGKLSMNDARWELRAGHNGTVMKPVASSFATKGSIILSGVVVLAFTQTLKLADFGGKTDIIVKDCKVLSGTLETVLNPTTGITGAFIGADGYYQAYGSVNIKNSYGFTYRKATSTIYGAYDDRYTCPVFVENTMTDPGGSYTIDAVGFMTYKSPTYHQRGVGLSYTQANRLVYNLDRGASAFTNIKWKMPFGTSPSKLIMFKHPSVRASNVQYRLYAVKDNAAWVNPLIFAVATDAILLVDSGLTTNRCGAMEFDVNLTSNYFDAGSYFESGKGLWTEGRMYLENVSGTMTGYAGVEYV